MKNYFDTKYVYYKISVVPKDLELPRMALMVKNLHANGGDIRERG